MARKPQGAERSSSVADCVHSAYTCEARFRTALRKRVRAIRRVHEIGPSDATREDLPRGPIEALHWHPVRVSDLRSAEGGVAAVYPAIVLRLGGPPACGEHDRQA